MTRADEVEAAHDEWMRNVEPISDEAREAWNALDCGSGGVLFRAAILDAFHGGWKARAALAMPREVTTPPATWGV